MRTILILTAGFGDGHNTAARSLRLAFLAQRNRCRVCRCDLFTIYGKWRNVLRKGYVHLANSTPQLWHATYTLMHRTPLIPTILPFLAGMKNRLADLLQRTGADTVVSTYPLYNYLLDSLERQGRLPNPLKRFTVVTDSITINSAWYRPFSDYFLVPNEDTAHIMIAKGVNPDRIYISGFPLPPVFASKTKLPLPGTETIPKVLFIINGRPHLAPEIVRRILERNKVMLTVALGRNEPMRSKIQGVAKRFDCPVNLIGWTNRIPQLLMQHHLLISKAGGATTQEAIAASIPMVISQVIPGQEEGNAMLIKKNRAGTIANSPLEIAEAISKAFANHSGVWKEWHSNIQKLALPNASERAASFILGAPASREDPAEEEVFAYI